MSKNTTTQTETIAPEFGEYKNSPTMTLKKMAEDRYPFTFGVGKAKLIIQHFEAIKKFVADNPGK